MSHEITETDKMAFRLQTGLPWHYGETGADGRAIPVDHDGPITAAMMIEAAGHDWDVSLTDAQAYVTADPDVWERTLSREFRAFVTFDTATQEKLEVARSPEQIERAVSKELGRSVFDQEYEDGRITLLRRIPRQYAVVREDNAEILGVVGDKYTPLQNRAAYRFLEAIMGQGTLDYETAGSLMGGRKIWILAKLREDLQPIDGVRLSPYVLLASSHDGSSSIRVRFTTVNVVCNNTLTAALSDKQVEFSVRHTAGATGDSIVEQAQRVLSLARNAFGTLTAEASQLARLSMSDEDFSAFAHVLVAPKPADADEDWKPSGRARNTIEFLQKAFRESPGVDQAPVAGTGWAALQAVTFFTTHAVTSRVTSARQDLSAERTPDLQRNEAHLDSVFFGASEKMARRA